MFSFYVQHLIPRLAFTLASIFVAGLIFLYPQFIEAQNVSRQCGLNIQQIDAGLRNADPSERARLRAEAVNALPDNICSPEDKRTIAGEPARQAALAAETRAAVAGGGCTWWNWPAKLSECLWSKILGFIGGTFLFVGGSVLHWAGTIFNILVTHVIIQFGATIQTLQLIDGIHNAWTVLRDISNIVIIGMFTFIAISIIIGNHTYGEKKLVAKVLVVAVLINFSLLFSKIIIDAANFFSFQIYKAMGSPSDAGGANISGKFLATTGVTSLFSGQAWSTSITRGEAAARSASQAGEDTTLSALGGASQAFFHGFIGGTMLLFAAGVLLYGSYLIIARAVLLIFLMLVSALAFATYLVPKLSDGEYGWSTWWKSLINAAIFGPLLMILLYVSLVVISRMPNAQNNAQDTSWIPILSLAIGIGMLYLSFKVANSFAGKIAGFSAAGGLVGKGLGLATGGAGALSRQTLGFGATKFAQSRWGRALTTAPIIGRPMRSALYGAATGTYDVRGVPGMKSFFKAAGMGVGDGAKDGYLKSLKSRQKAIKEREEERVGFFTTKNRSEKKIDEAHKGTESEGERIAGQLASDKKKRDDAETVRSAAQKEGEDLKTKATEVLRKSAGQAGQPVPAFSEQQTLSATRVRIEEGRKAASDAGDHENAEQLRLISERLGELGTKIGEADKTMASLDSSTAENSRKLEALRPELEKNKTAYEQQTARQRETLANYKTSIGKEFYAGLFGDRQLSREIATDVIKNVTKTPQEKQSENLMHLLETLGKQGAPPPAAPPASTPAPKGGGAPTPTAPNAH